MSTYTFNIQKRPTVDDSTYTQYQESFDSAKEANAAMVDVSVAITLDGVTKHTITLGDSAADLTFDADLSTGDHVIRIVPQKTPTVATDVVVNSFAIGSDTCCLTTYNFNAIINGTASTVRQMLADPQAQWNNHHNNHTYVWWGEMVTVDSTYDLSGDFYRPAIVSDHAGEWKFNFTKTSDGDIWMTHYGDITSVMYDSTELHDYYFCKKPANASESLESLIANYYNDSTTVQGFHGAGSYDADLVWLDSSLDETAEDDNRIVVFSETEYDNLLFNQWYHKNYTVTKISVT